MIHAGVDMLQPSLLFCVINGQQSSGVSVQEFEFFAYAHAVHRLKSVLFLHTSCTCQFKRRLGQWLLGGTFTSHKTRTHDMPVLDS
jgi:hypothetical protein